MLIMIINNVVNILWLLLIKLLVGNPTVVATVDIDLSLLYVIHYGLQWRVLLLN